MSLHELLPSVRALSRRDKLCLIQLLAQDLAANEPEGWSPRDQFEAAGQLMEMLEAEKGKP